jgi:predicted transcriptional regulator
MYQKDLIDQIKILAQAIIEQQESGQIHPETMEKIKKIYGG